ncbi:MAG: hypothetical protein COZ06_09535 [Armatimonadetes bacterium CG_4_10_14_3_um_filter_66_18]|nr:IS200/IS605 family transposase [Armatimonadota bacterium]OIO96572.1 MAG: hypothetical protein AUJ96_24560 [Armatimonadetes bacterium CG2_30_66_41]PIU87765.1 MAG: hypothetical protein COS65_33060 [Armatimonadetes bacterium CG06_land_8_20_14_3_00_66_21]PIX39523.1 MAG: hypothetical protein COZ57_28060 [Armatimonadetes bacterium CG_4_8_14_3_um_filter_66_20]PIY50404.1 MAG: hypothetical protein COZ06_09535 [Armatimonadetes bacterium CG_4_10_14_3_um_filter_66_18]PJB76280.1 MAG: hypothetical protei
MPKRHVFHQLYYHFVWSTKDRERLVTADIQPGLVQFIRDKCTELEARAIEVNAQSEHVHLLVELLPKHAPAEAIGQVKGASAYRVNHELSPARRLGWQEGYGVVTLRKGELKDAVAYVRDQERRHRERKVSEVLETFEMLVG